MIVEINTETKTIRIKGTHAISELIKFLGVMFPDCDYQDWRITDYNFSDVLRRSQVPNQLPIQYNPNQWISPQVTPVTGDPHWEFDSGKITFGTTSNTPDKPRDLLVSELMYKAEK